MAGSIAKDTVSALEGNKTCFKTVAEDAVAEGITGAFLGPLGWLADANPIGTLAGNLANVGTYALTVTDTALGSVPNTLNNEGE